MKRILLGSSSSFLSLLAAACAASGPASAPVATQTKSAIAPAAAPELALRQPGPVPRASADARAKEDAALVAKLIEQSGRDNRVQEHLHHLCVDIGPRLTSSHNLEQAQQWALEQFRTWGLDAQLERWGEYPVGFDRGPFHGGIVGEHPVAFEFTTMAWSAGTHGAQRGRVLFKPETEEQLAEVKDQLAGAWLVARVYADSADRPKVDKEARERIADALAAAGIAGEIRGGRFDAEHPDSERNKLVLTDGNYKIEWDKRPTTPRVSVRADQYHDLVQRVQSGEPVEVEFDIDNRFYEGPVPQYNVIADIRGVELPDEYVIVGGHLDSWDGAQGAVDNGTGAATTLEAARLLTAVGAHPRRTIRFALWSGEEQGLFGSVGYVRDHKDELPRISAVYIHDEGTNYLSGLGVTADMEAQMRKVCAPLFDLDPAMPFALRVTDGFQFSPDSDHAPFAQKGVPGFFWDQDGKSNYNHMHHTQYDTFDAAIPEYQKHSALVAAIAAYDTANLPGLISRENFKAPEPRRMGVQLDGTKLANITSGGKAESAGWKVGDVVQSVDGVAVTKQGEISRELQKGGPRKVIVLLRGTERVETVLDYSDDPSEIARAKRAEMRAAHGQAQQKKFW